jgi:hypothetical protein
MDNYNYVINKSFHEVKKYYTKKDKENGFHLSIISQQFRMFSNITIVKVKAKDLNKKIVLKTVKYHHSNQAALNKRNQASVEFNILKKIYPRFFKIPKCSVPKPILVMPEYNTYAMEFVEGNLLSNKLSSARFFSTKRDFDQLLEYYYLSGKWLYNFQKVNGIHKSPSKQALSSVLERANERLNYIDKSNNKLISKDFKTKTMAFLIRKLEEIKGKQIIVSERHSDFLPWNIIVGNNGICVIDFLGCEVDCAVVDIFKIFISLEDEKRCLTSYSKKIDLLKQKFLLGYGDLPKLPIQALIICEAMQRIVSIWGNLNNKDKRLHHRIESFSRIKGHLNWFEQLKKKYQ